LIVSQLLIVAGAVAIELAVKKRAEISGFAALIVLYSTPFAFGLVNFEFGLGLALFGIASWIALENRSWQTRLAVHSLFVFAVFTAHFFALGIYGVTIGLYELWRLSSRRFDARGAMGIFAILASPATVILALMLIMGGAIGGGDTEWRIDAKILALLLSMSGYNFILSISIIAVLGALLYFLFREQYLTMGPAGRWIAGGFLILYALMPFRVFGTGYVDTRIIIAAILILPAFMLFSPSTRRVSFLAGSIATGVILMNATHAGYLALAHADDYAAMKASFRLIQPRSQVLIGRSRDDVTDLPMHHAPTLAVHYAGALVPSLYALPGMQPVTVRPEFRHLAISDPRQFYPVPLPTLKMIAAGHEPPQTPQFLRHWHQDFDYLYLVGPTGPNPLPNLLHESAIGHRFALYRIRR
jgi:hypothetical protein